MVKRRSLLLPLYRLTSRGLRPLMPAVLHWRRRRGKEDRNRVRERMGIAGLPRPHGRLVWVHAASLDDGQTLLPLIDRLGARGFHVLMSTRTVASANALKRQLPGGSFHQYMPIDVPFYVARFLDHWQPDMVLLAGAELWPNVLIESSLRGMPIILVNARLSDRVYRYCVRMRPFIVSLIQRIDLCLARSDADAERFVELGAASVQTVGDLVFDVPSPGADPKAVSAFATRVGARPIWVAALTDPEEDALILETHRLLLPRFPDLITVVVPRLPRDGAVIAEAASSRNLAVALRSRDRMPGSLPSLYVADVGGELGLFYRTSDIAFVGRSLAGGGHSPVEAAKLGCAILHGPRVERFSAIYAALDHAQGGATVRDAPMLVRVLALLFDDGAKLRLMQRNATQAIDNMCGGTTRVMRAIEPQLVQMLVER